MISRAAVTMLAWAAVFSGALAQTSGFLPMTPLGSDCLPVRVVIKGTPELTDLVREQMQFDIEFSGLLRVDEEKYYGEVTVDATRGERGTVLSVRLEAGGETLMDRQYLSRSRSDDAVYPLVHAVADDMVYLLTGEQGISSTRLAYIRRSDSSYALVVKSLDPREPVLVLRDEQVITTPSWSPCGDLIALTSYRSGTSDLYVYDLSEGQATRLLSGEGLHTSPAWSPDGERLALTVSEGANSEITLYDLGSEQLLRLTARSSIETAPDFSPNGRQIIFTSDRLGFPQLYVMDSRGGSATRLTGVHRYMDSPAWSPLGDRIAYVARCGGDFHIFVSNADGRDVRQVTFDGTLNENPVWSPTGRHIAFSSDRDGSRAIYVLELNSLKVHKLSYSGECYFPTWSPVARRPAEGG
jgi:TolB protein